MSNKQKLSVFVLVLFLSFIPSTIIAQGLKVKEMKQVMSDLSGSVNQRLDSKGVPCGLVKVMLETPNVSFGGKVVGDVDNKMNEYWVYMPNGTKDLTIKRKNFLPMLIRFADFGINEVESKATYHLVLKEVSFKRNSIYICVTPNHANLSIDNIMIEKDPNGVYDLYLDKGEHIFIAEAKGYVKYVNAIEIGKNNEPLNINLESLLANVTISSETNGADIAINGEKVGTGTWSGPLPAGNYLLSSQKDGYESYQKEIVFSEKEEVNIRIPQLKQLKGRICVITNITDFTEVKVDGKDTELLKGHIPNVTSGKHIITLGKYGYGSVDISINVKGKNKDTIKHTFLPLKEYERAIQGDESSIYQVAINCNVKKDYKQAIYWFNLAKNHMRDYYAEVDLRTFLAQIYSNRKDIPDYYDLQKAKELYIEIINISKEEKKIKREWNNRAGCDERIGIALISIGSLYKDNAQYEEAISWYKQCKDFDQHDGGFYIGYCLDIGDCYVKLGKIEEARFWYSRIIGSSEEAKRKLKLLNFEHPN